VGVRARAAFGMVARAAFGMASPQLHSLECAVHETDGCTPGCAAARGAGVVTRSVRICDIVRNRINA